MTQSLSDKLALVRGLVADEYQRFSLDQVETVFAAYDERGREIERLREALLLHTLAFGDPSAPEVAEYYGREMGRFGFPRRDHEIHTAVTTLKGEARDKAHTALRGSP